MGWHSFGDKGQCVTGDEPFDIAANAAQQMADAYTERFGRLPLLAEVLHALRVVIEASADEFLYDPERLETDWPATRLPAEAPLDLDGFGAGWSEHPEPEGSYYVSLRATKEEVLRCSIRVAQRTLFVDYEVLQQELDEVDVERLVQYTLIRDFLRDTYAGKVDQVSIAAAASPARRILFAYQVRS